MTQQMFGVWLPESTEWLTVVIGDVCRPFCWDDAEFAALRAKQVAANLGVKTEVKQVPAETQRGWPWRYEGEALKIANRLA